jgi:TP901 family phage tail tape measure protein
VGSIGSIFVNVGANIQGFLAGMGQVGSTTGALSAKMATFGTNMTKYVTLPILALGALSIKAAVDFETAFAGVRKTVDATEEEFAALEKGIRDMSKELPASAVEIAGVAEAAGQLGIATENILSFTRVMIDLGETTNMSAEEAATALARLANITQMPQENFDRLGSTIVELGNNLATTEGEIVEMGLRLAGAGHQVGMTEPQILSLAGALSSVGIEAQAGGTAFSRVMVNMQLAVEKGGQGLKDFASVAGMSADQFKTAFQQDAAGALIAFIEGLGKAEEQGLTAIGVLDDMGISEVRVRDALLRAAGAGDLFNESIKLGTEAWEENTALTDEANKRYETTAARMEVLRNRLVDVGIDVGEKLLPVVVKVAEFVGKIADAFAALPGPVQNAILVMLGVAVVIGPLIKVGLAVKGVGVAISAMCAGGVVSFGLLAAAIAAVAAGLAAIGWAANEWWKANEKMRTANAQSVTQMAKFGDSVFGVRDTLKDLGYDLSGVGDDFYKLTEVQHEALSQMVADTQEAVKNISPLPDSIIQAWSSKSNQFRTVAHMQMQKYIGEMLVQGGMAKEEATNVAAGITDGLSSKDPEVKQAAYNTFKLYLAEMVTQGALTTEQARAIMGSISSALELEPSREQEMVSGWLRWKNSLVGLFGEVVGAANGAAAALSNAGGTHSGGVGGTFTKMQHGGIVTRPTLALIGEAGPEAVVPLSGPHAGVAGLTVSGGTFHFHGVQDVAGFEAALRGTAQKSQLRGAVLPA